MTVERLQVFDINQTVDLAEEFNEIYNQSKKFNRQKMRSLLESSVVYPSLFFCLVKKDVDKVIGLFVGYASEGLYTDDRLAGELGWYVRPGYRGPSSIKMLRSFETWAKEEAKADFVVMSYTTPMTDLHKLYTQEGYERIEFTYRKKLK
jgi:hypothetical protein